jgi:hypothetical protein
MMRIVMKVGELVSILLWVPTPDPALHFKHESNETLNPIDRRIERGICDHCQWKKCMDGYTGRMMISLAICKELLSKMSLKSQNMNEMVVKTKDHHLDVTCHHEAPGVESFIYVCFHHREAETNLFPSSSGGLCRFVGLVSFLKLLLQREVCLIRFTFGLGR